MQASVTNLELFRSWQQDEDLSLEWLLRRIRGEEPPTDAMLAGRAFHEALEKLQAPEANTLLSSDYRFDFNCLAEIPAPQLREVSVEKQYGDLLVRGRADCWMGRQIVDFKTTQQFDAERLLEGYQWRFYLDMTDCDLFSWKVFVMREFGGPGCYDVHQVHSLEQRRYPGLHDDCQRLAQQYTAVLGSVLA